MGRRPDPRRRAELLESAAAYLEQHGVAGVSLRPLAHDLGTTPRGLLYHFGSKEQLLAEAVAHLQNRYERLSASDDDGELSVLDQARHLWRHGTRPEALAFLRVFFELYAAALREPEAHRAFLDRVIGQWLSPLVPALEATGLSSQRARVVATQLVAMNLGLVFDLLATGDRGRVDEAFDAFLAQVGQELTEPRHIRMKSRARRRNSPESSPGRGD